MHPSLDWKDIHGFVMDIECRVRAAPVKVYEGYLLFLDKNKFCVCIVSNSKDN